MTVLNPTRTYTVAGNGSTTQFQLPSTLRIFQDTDVVVNLRVTATGANEPALTLNTHYSVLGADTPLPTVVMVTAPPVGKTLVVKRQMTASQQANITNLGAFYPEIHEQALDKLTLLLADLAEDLSNFDSNPYALAAGSTIGGFAVGYRDLPVNIVNAAKTFALGDEGQAFGKDNATAYTHAIPANSVVAFPIGTVIDGFNNGSAGNLTIAINTDTLRWSNTGATGSRTIGLGGAYRIWKVAATTWLIQGFGIT